MSVQQAALNLSTGAEEGKKITLCCGWQDKKKKPCLILRCMCR